VHDGDHLVAHIVELLDLDLPVIPDCGPVVEESLRSLGTGVDRLLGPSIVVRHVPDEVRLHRVCWELPGFSEALVAATHTLDVLLRHRLSPFLGEPFCGCLGLVDVDGCPHTHD
jgi:hypothetical protein